MLPWQRLAAVDVIALEADVSKAARAEAALRARAMLGEGEPGLDARIEARAGSTAKRWASVGKKASRTTGFCRM